jgi:hypothetical protein
LKDIGILVGGILEYKDVPPCKTIKPIKKQSFQIAVRKKGKLKNLIWI